jgi:hypothetical protein
MPKATIGHYRIMKRTVVWLTERQLRELERMSKDSLAPISALIRHAVDKFVGRGGKPSRKTTTRRKPSRTATARRLVHTQKDHPDTF